MKAMLDRGLMAIVGAAAPAPPAPAPPPASTDPMTAQPAQLSAEQLRDLCFVTAGNAVMFGLGLMALTEHKGGGIALLKTGAALAIPGVLFALVPDDAPAGTKRV